MDSVIVRLDVLRISPVSCFGYCFGEFFSELLKRDSRFKLRLPSASSVTNSSSPFSKFSRVGDLGLRADWNTESRATTLSFSQLSSSFTGLLVRLISSCSSLIDTYFFSLGELNAEETCSLFLSDGCGAIMLEGWVAYCFIDCRVLASLDTFTMCYFLGVDLALLT